MGGTLAAVPGAKAAFESEVTLTGETSFSERGTIRFDSLRLAIYINEAGQILPSPEISVPMHELWLYRNPETLKAVIRGVEEAREGKLADLGSLQTARGRRHRLRESGGVARFQLLFTPEARSALLSLAKSPSSSKRLGAVRKSLAVSKRIHAIRAFRLTNMSNRSDRTAKRSLRLTTRIGRRRHFACSGAMDLTAAKITLVAITPHP